MEKLRPQSAKDQASALRELVSGARATTNGVLHTSSSSKRTMSVAILSGKGGVGKSSTAVNISIALSDAGRSVAVIDADLGLACIDIMFGVTPRFDLRHVLRGERTLDEISHKICDKLAIIPGGVGLAEMADLDDQRLQMIMSRLASFDDAEILIVDTSAGIHKNVLSFALASDLAMIVTTPDPTAVRDAYSVLKALVASSDGDTHIGLVVNMAADSNEAADVATRLISASSKFLDYDLAYLGHIVWDQDLRRSIRARRPVLMSNVKTTSGECFKELAQRIDRISADKSKFEHRRGSFLDRLADIFKLKKK